VRRLLVAAGECGGGFRHPSGVRAPGARRPRACRRRLRAALGAATDAAIVASAIARPRAHCRIILPGVPRRVVRTALFNPALAPGAAAPVLHAAGTAVAGPSRGRALGGVL